MQEEQVVGVGVEGRAERGVEGGICRRGKGGANVDLRHRDRVGAQGGAQEAHVVELVRRELSSVRLHGTISVCRNRSWKLCSIDTQHSDWLILNLTAIGCVRLAFMPPVEAGPPPLQVSRKLESSRLHWCLQGKGSAKVGVKPGTIS